MLGSVASVLDRSCGFSSLGLWFWVVWDGNYDIIWDLGHRVGFSGMDTRRSFSALVLSKGLDYGVALFQAGVGQVKALGRSFELSRSIIFLYFTNSPLF